MYVWQQRTQSCRISAARRRRIAFKCKREEVEAVKNYYRQLDHRAETQPALAAYSQCDDTPTTPWKTAHHPTESLPGGGSVLQFVQAGGCWWRCLLLFGFRRADNTLKKGFIRVFFEIERYWWLYQVYEK